MYMFKGIVIALLAASIFGIYDGWNRATAEPWLWYGLAAVLGALGGIYANVSKYVDEYNNEPFYYVAEEK